MRRSRCPGLFVVPFAVLLGCSPPPTPAAQGPDDATAIEAMQARLNSRNAGGYGSSRACAEFFDLSNLRIVDRRVESDVATIEVKFDVLSKYEIGDQAFASKGCFGAPTGGWVVNQTATSGDTFTFERWQSGWRLR